MVTRRNHMDGLVLPDFFSRVPAISYIDPLEHRIKLHYDLAEESEEPQFVYCGQCKKYYPLSEMTVKRPPNPRGKGELSGKGIARAYDEAVRRDRIVRLLVIGGLTQKEVAARVNVSQQFVSKIAGEVQNMLSEGSVVPPTTVEVSAERLDAIPEPTAEELRDVELYPVVS